MNKFIKSIFDLNALEQFAKRKLWINSLSPAFKILVTMFYIICNTFLHKYDLSRALIFGIYPILFFSIVDIPYKAILGKLIIPATLSVTLGILNPFLDRDIILHFGDIPISGGLLSFATLFVKALNTISATLLLVSTTTIDSLGRGLAFYKIPSRFIMLLLLMYRYIGILLDEVSRTMEAYQLRSSCKSIHISVWGSLVGQIMIRSYKRSEEIYNAMLLRGYGTK